MVVHKIHVVKKKSDVPNLLMGIWTLATEHHPSILWEITPSALEILLAKWSVQVPFLLLCVRKGPLKALSTRAFHSTSRWNWGLALDVS